MSYRQPALPTKSHTTDVPVFPSEYADLWCQAYAAVLTSGSYYDGLSGMSEGARFQADAAVRAFIDRFPASTRS